MTYSDHNNGMQQSHQTAKIVKRFIIDAIDPEVYDSGASTDAEKLAFFNECFESEYGYAIERYGRNTALAEYLSGLPSIIALPFYNSDILKHAVEWGSLAQNATEQEEDKILENYWQFMANKLNQMIIKRRC